MSPGRRLRVRLAPLDVWARQACSKRR
jgi:hypothetical protein